MKVLRRALCAIVVVVLFGSACRAQGHDSIWSDWETSAVEKHGPQRAAGLLLYFHGNAGPADATEDPIPLIFTEMAKAATWDVLRGGPEKS